MSTIVINADANTVAALYTAFSKLDGNDEVQKVNGFEQSFRVPYKLGPKLRMIVVRNIIETRRAAVNFDEVKVGLLREIWPDAPDMRRSMIPIQDFPPGAYTQFNDAVKQAAIDHKEKITLFTIGEELLTKGESEFPLEALQVLLENGLLVSDDEATKPKRKRK